jgi:hypothetical protein
MKDPTCPLLSHKLPPDVNEVAYVIAKIHKYGNIDDYAEKLIREDIEKMRKNDDTEDSFKQYLIQYYYHHHYHCLLIRLLQTMNQPKKMMIMMIMKISV